MRNGFAVLLMILTFIPGHCSAAAAFTSFNIDLCQYWFKPLLILLETININYLKLLTHGLSEFLYTYIIMYVFMIDCSCNLVAYLKLVAINVYLPYTQFSIITNYVSKYKYISSFILQKHNRKSF